MSRITFSFLKCHVWLKLSHKNNNYLRGLMALFRSWGFQQNSLMPFFLLQPGTKTSYTRNTTHILGPGLVLVSISTTKVQAVGLLNLLAFMILTLLLINIAKIISRVYTFARHLAAYTHTQPVRMELDWNCASSHEGHSAPHAPPHWG